MPVLDDILLYLDAASASFTKASGSAGNLAKGANLDEVMPNTFMSLYDTAGFRSAFVFTTSNAAAANVAYEQPAFQLLSRSTSYKTARDNANIAYQLLDGVHNSTLAGTTMGTRYLSIEAVAPPFFIGRDKNKRVLFSCNFTVMKETT